MRIPAYFLAGLALLPILAALTLPACAARPEPPPAKAAEVTQSDLESCFARAPENRCGQSEQTCLEKADPARWGDAHIELVSCYQRGASGWELTSKRIDRAEAEVMFTAAVTERGVECYFYGPTSWDALAHEARGLATKWAKCTVMLESDPF
ncbi:MAG TPA: hypothetical protein PK668_28030 [Myxococcota bacterium]|nr:hypothetical protein [Myxococcota bacterium]HRY97347.1 hypothetical protein [Myxococcota bacterium]